MRHHDRASTRRRTRALPAGLALTLAACAGGDGSADPNAEPPATTTAPTANNGDGDRPFRVDTVGLDLPPAEEAAIRADLAELLLAGA